MANFRKPAGSRGVHKVSGTPHVFERETIKDVQVYDDTGNYDYFDVDVQWVTYRSIKRGDQVLDSNFAIRDVVAVRRERRYIATTRPVPSISIEFGERGLRSAPRIEGTGSKPDTLIRKVEGSRKSRGWGYGS